MSVPTSDKLSRHVRVALLATSGSFLFFAIALTGSVASDYAPNNWVFSHTFLADLAIMTGEIPLNTDYWADNSFSATRGALEDATGLHTMTLYATTIWHFWNGVPLHPTYAATVSILTGLSPEQALRIPVAGLLTPLFAYASASLVLRRVPHVNARYAAAAPLVAAIASAPLALELRVAMPSSSIFIMQLLLHLLLRRTMVGDGTALPFALAPLALLPFWYYTLAYFAIVVFAGFFVVNVVTYAFRARAPKRAFIPTAVTIAVPIFLLAALNVNGALTSHVELARSIDTNPLLDPKGGTDAGLDYGSHLNREPWRSALLYVQVLVLFAPMTVISVSIVARLARARRIPALDAVIAQWAFGGTLFSLILLALTNVSFLNRGVIYLTPVAGVSIAYLVASRRHRLLGKWTLAVVTATLLVTTPALMVTSTPSFNDGDHYGFLWMESRIPRDATVYGTMEATSVLFRAYDFHEAAAFHPRQTTVEDFWYSEDPETLPPYLASLDYFVLRRDVIDNGFEDFSPARHPIGLAAFEKFSKSRDLQRVFDNGAIQIFLVGLAPGRLVSDADR